MPEILDNDVNGKDEFTDCCIFPGALASVHNDAYKYRR